MRYYCTLFDKKYLAKGLAMYQSLKRWSSEAFILYILPLDFETDVVLQELRLPGVIVLDSTAFEHDQDLVRIKEFRCHKEYAWTCASNLVEWMLCCHECNLPE